ncbi:MAG: hypothetical protein KJ718_00495 [Nanoarchaeota archaeon]|nr:hypothetical protein [Nanoarchaeota archaeon]MBU1051020.1 hypothetical protein [Nanoarchaeota archaeon]MBU1988132.1 hypothetical protein [Nanoarchaeota archaeon]
MFQVGRVDARVLLKDEESQELLEGILRRWEVMVERWDYVKKNGRIVRNNFDDGKYVTIEFFIER